jgi:hypothetical protein
MAENSPNLVTLVLSRRNNLAVHISVVSSVEITKKCAQSFVQLTSFELLKTHSVNASRNFYYTFSITEFKPKAPL